MGGRSPVKGFGRMRSAGSFSICLTRFSMGMCSPKGDVVVGKFCRRKGLLYMSSKGLRKEGAVGSPSAHESKG